jgi:hypothetical protein
MGLFWDLIQQSQIGAQHARAESLEDRIAALEAELRDTQRLVHSLLQVLEERLGQDIDGDGRVG